MANLFGTGINQVPTNGMLGNLAFQDKAYVSVDKVGIGSTFVDSGTSNQLLQVYGGGAYVSGSVGIGTTTPSSLLTVQGNALITGIGTITTLSGTTASFGTINVTTGNIVTGVITNAQGNNLNYTGVGTITNLGGTNVNYTGVGTIATLNSTVATLTNLGGTNVNYTGVGTIATLNSTVATLTNLGGTNVNYSGVGTITTFNATSSSVTNRTGTNLNITGVGTVGSLNIGATQVISSGRQLQNIASLDSTTTATIESAIANAPNTFTDLNVTGVSTFTNGPVLIGSGTSTGTASQRLQVTGGAYISSNTGIGTTNPQYIFTVTDTGTPATTGLTNCLADFTTTANSYGQINLRNTSTGTNASSDIIVTSDNGSDTTNFIDLGINNSGFSVGSWTINGANDGYLYTSDGNLSIGAINASVAKYISFFTGGTLLSNERMRINAIGVGIGTTNPTSKLQVTGDTLITGVSTSSRLTLNGANSTATDGGQIFLNGATGNRIDFNTNGVAAPAFTTRSAGTKIVLYPSVGASKVDYAFGINANVLWSSVEDSGSQFRWFAGTTQLADLKGSGEFLLGTTSLTGTASQRLQVTGGAYVSGNLGIGNTLPTSKLVVQGDARFVSSGQGDVSITHSSLVSTIKGASTVQLALGANNNEVIRINNSSQVGIGTASPAFTADIAGDARVTSTNKMRFGGTAGTTNFYIQYNSTANSLDFVAG